jgi:hypothetical protein
MTDINFRPEDEGFDRKFVDNGDGSYTEIKASLSPDSGEEIIFRPEDEKFTRKFVDNGDGSYSEYVVVSGLEADVLYVLPKATNSTLGGVIIGSGLNIDDGVLTATAESLLDITEGHVIENEGTPVTQRSNMNFTGDGVSVADTGGKTVVTISGAVVEVEEAPEDGNYYSRKDGAWDQLLFGIIPSGGTEYDDGDYRVHVFNSSGTLTVYQEMDVELLVVGAGGSSLTSEAHGGAQGGGGGGQVVHEDIHTLSAGSLSVVVGVGVANSNGQSSSIDGVTAIGGGRGGAGDEDADQTRKNGANGGNGGGAAGNYDRTTTIAGIGGTGTAGYDGGSTPANSHLDCAGAGGGGAGEAGQSLLVVDDTGGNGGDGVAFDITGTTTYYGGGGGGGSSIQGMFLRYRGDGGLGGGGKGGCNQYGYAFGEDGTPNTGGGAGGPMQGGGALGGSGIVVIRYKTPISIGQLASDVIYIPAVSTDWNGNTDPGQVDDALDQLASRIDSMEIAAGDVFGPSVTTSGYLAAFNGTTGKLLREGPGLVTTVGESGSDSNVPSEQAVREAISAIPSGLEDSPDDNLPYIRQNGEWAILSEAILVDPGTGGTVDTDSTYRYHTFTSSGDFLLDEDIVADILLVGGGGSGGGWLGGGGGAGGVRQLTGISLPKNTVLPVVIGEGGTEVSGGNRGNSGGASTFNGYSAAGGGGGGTFNGTRDGISGGSGGGGSGNWDWQAGSPPGSGNTPSTTPSQGNSGGYGGIYYNGGGGGGAGAAGQNSSSGSSGNGGAGVLSTIPKTPSYFGGGGGGGGNSGSQGTGGSGVGGNGGAVGLENTGSGGGGGADWNSNHGKAGGKGILVIRYLLTAGNTDLYAITDVMYKSEYDPDEDGFVTTSGATGTFTSQDSKTITVVSGMITSIV